MTVSNEECEAHRRALAEAWASGYWRGTSHTGPLNDATVNELNPYTDTEEK